MTPIKEQILHSQQRMKEAKEKGDMKEYHSWDGYLKGLNYAKLWYESEQGKKEIKGITA